MPGFQLQTSQGEQVGFLMLEGKESVGTGANPRDCLFMSIPARMELEEHELNVFLSEHKNTEYRCSFSQSEEGWEGTILISESVRVQLHFAVGESGVWRVQDANGRDLLGTCHLL